jgi:AraC-like DNA-binding protein
MDASKGMTGKIVFASDDLPADLDERERFSLWRDIYASLYGDADFSYLPDRRFATRAVFRQIDGIGLARAEGTLSSYARTRRGVAADPRGDFILGFILGAPQWFSQRGREVAVPVGAPNLFTNAEPIEARYPGGAAWLGVGVQRETLLERVPNAEDLICTPLDPDRAVIRYLRQYSAFLLAADDIGVDASLTEQITTTVLDLIVLALDAQGDEAKLATMRGLRAVRAREIVAEIKAHFTDPAFSPDDLARKLRLSERYVQRLLQETGTSFSERVLELRLQKARGMLADRGYDQLRVSEIAFASGFNGIAYFNQCFRRRFGATPSQYRGGRAI